MTTKMIAAGMVASHLHRVYGTEVSAPVDRTGAATVTGLPAGLTLVREQ
ncbi:hypothetical protein ACIBF5_10380 [Micromonospora sp. NPDC050417]